MPESCRGRWMTSLSSEGVSKTGAFIFYVKILIRARARGVKSQCILSSLE